jgi:hypothetical protein
MFSTGVEGEIFRSRLVIGKSVVARVSRLRSDTIGAQTALFFNAFLGRRTGAHPKSAGQVFAGKRSIITESESRSLGCLRINYGGESH